MALYLGNKKVAVTNTIEKQVPSMKAFFEAGGKCQGSTVTSFEGLIQYDDTENITNMNGMFANCESLTITPLLNTSKVTSMYETFKNCSSITTIQKMDTSKVTSMNGMFYGCYGVKTFPFFDTSNVEIMITMFANCSGITEIPQYDTSRVSQMYYMFFSCSRLVTVPQFNVKNVYDMRGMFNGCRSIEHIHMININANLDISASTKFTREALIEIIGNLKAQTSGTKTLTMGSTNLAKLTDEDKKIATDKGWTLA